MADTRRRMVLIISDLQDLKFTDSSPNSSAKSIGPNTVDVQGPSRYWFPFAIAGILTLLIACGTFLFYQWQSVPSVPPTAAAHTEITVTAMTNGTAVLDATVSPDGKYFVYHEMSENKQHISPLRLPTILLATFILPTTLAPARAQAQPFPYDPIPGARFTVAVVAALRTAASARGSNAWRR